MSQERLEDFARQIMDGISIHGPGMEVVTPHGQLWTFRNGRAARMRWFNTHRETLEAAGLRE
jgi:hypothetical protein